MANSVISDTRCPGHDGNFYSDPHFVGVAVGNYRLLPTSPCIDVGDPTGALVGPLDLDRTERILDGDTSAVVDCGAYEVDAPGTPEIAVFGGGYLISDGDVVPIPWDGAAFGAARVAGKTLTHTFTIRNTGVATLTLTGTPGVAITGANAPDFTVVTQPAGYVLAGETTTLSIAFDPSTKGLRTASVSIATDELDENPTMFSIQGVGTTPEIRIEGNDVLIPDGDTTPSETDGTDFGTVSTGGHQVGECTCF